MYLYIESQIYERVVDRRGTSWGSYKSNPLPQASRLAESLAGQPKYKLSCTAGILCTLLKQTSYSLVILHSIDLFNVFKENQENNNFITLSILLKHYRTRAITFCDEYIPIAALTHGIKAMLWHCLARL